MAIIQPKHLKVATFIGYTAVVFSIGVIVGHYVF
jgi:hypothetical protein